MNNTIDYSSEINPTVTPAQVEAEARARDRDIRRRAAAGVRLVAEIKKSSKYFGQGFTGERFPVVVQAGNEYVFRGGPGGQYRSADVHLFALVDEDGTLVQLT